MYPSVVSWTRCARRVARSLDLPPGLGPRWLRVFGCELHPAGDLPGADQVRDDQPAVRIERQLGPRIAGVVRGRLGGFDVLRLGVDVRPYLVTLNGRRLELASTRDLNLRRRLTTKILSVDVRTSSTVADVSYTTTVAPETWSIIAIVACSIRRSDTLSGSPKRGSIRRCRRRFAMPTSPTISSRLPPIGSTVASRSFGVISTLRRAM